MLSTVRGFQKTMDFMILLLHGLYKLYEMHCPVTYSDVCYVTMILSIRYLWVLDTIICPSPSVKLIHQM